MDGIENIVRRSEFIQIEEPFVLCVGISGEKNQFLKIQLSFMYCKRI